MTTIEPIGHTEYTAHKEREILRLKVNEIIEALNGISINNAKITLKQGSAIKGDFTLNQPIDKTIELDAGGSAGGFVWGEGTGTITNQTDLVNYIAEEIADEAELREEEDDTLATAINTLDGAVVKKTAIKTAIESTLADDDVVSGKAIFNKYSAITDLTLTVEPQAGITITNISGKKVGQIVQIGFDIANTSGAHNHMRIFNDGVLRGLGTHSLISQEMEYLIFEQLSNGTMSLSTTGNFTTQGVSFTYITREV